MIMMSEVKKLLENLIPLPTSMQELPMRIGKGVAAVHAPSLLLQVFSTAALT